MGLWQRLTKSKNPDSKKFRREMAYAVCGQHIKYVTEKHNDVIINKVATATRKIFFISTASIKFIRLTVQIYFTAVLIIYHKYIITYFLKNKTTQWLQIYHKSEPNYCKKKIRCNITLQRIE